MNTGTALNLLAQGQSQPHIGEIDQTTDFGIDPSAILRQAEALMRDSYGRLPENYFDGKDSRTHLFNNIEKLFNSYPKLPSSGPAAFKEQIAKELTIGGSFRLYAGVPWCEQVCAFCNYAYSTSRNPETHADYIRTISAELEILKDYGLAGRKAASVYLGGGTPTVMEDAFFERYLRSILGALDLDAKASVTCEATTNTLTREKLRIMKDSGVNRLSMGVQSLDDGVRRQARLLGSASDVLEKLSLARDFFGMVNIDLIYGSPYQSDQSWLETVEQAVALDLPSITIYRLEVKDRTSNLKLYRQRVDDFQCESSARRQYFIARLILSAEGYEESPLGWWIKSNIPRANGTWSKHVQNWARAIPYIGIGQGAWSQGETAYYENHKNFAKWSEAVREKRAPIESFRELDPRAGIINGVLRLMRTARCIDTGALRRTTAGRETLPTLLGILARQVEWGLLERSEEWYRLTMAGESLIHWILDDIVRSFCEVPR